VPDLLLRSACLTVLLPSTTCSSPSATYSSPVGHARAAPCATHAPLQWDSSSIPVPHRLASHSYPSVSPSCSYPSAAPLRGRHGQYYGEATPHCYTASLSATTLGGSGRRACVSALGFCRRGYACQLPRCASNNVASTASATAPLHAGARRAHTRPSRGRARGLSGVPTTACRCCSGASLLLLRLTTNLFDVPFRSTCLTLRRDKAVAGSFRSVFLTTARCRPYA
jgi:hypothetical protein